MNLISLWKTSILLVESRSHNEVNEWYASVQ